MKKISVIVDNNKKEVPTEDQQYIINKIMELKNNLGVRINIKFV